MERKELLMGVEISVKSVFIHFDVKNEREGEEKPMIEMKKIPFLNHIYYKIANLRLQIIDCF